MHKAGADAQGRAAHDLHTSDYSHVHIVHARSTRAHEHAGMPSARQEAWQTDRPAKVSRVILKVGRMTDSKSKK